MSTTSCVRSGNSTAVHRAAVEFARRGYLVFPANAATRAPWFGKGTHPTWAPDPAGAAGLRCATREVEAIESAWPLAAGVAIGLVPPEGVVVIDADEKHREGIVGLLLDRWPQLRDGGHHVTRSHGAHFPLRLPISVELGQSVDPQLGVDVRVGGRGYVIAPPCAGYRVERPFKHVEALPEVPLELVDLLLERAALRAAPAPRSKRTVRVSCPRRYVWSVVREEHDGVARTQEGARNVALHRAAVRLGTFVGAGVLALEDATDALLAAAVKAGLARREAMRTIASGISYGVKHPRSVVGGVR